MREERMCNLGEVHQRISLERVKNIIKISIISQSNIFENSRNFEQN